MSTLKVGSSGFSSRSDTTNSAEIRASEVDVLRLVYSMVASGAAFCVPGNHDVKFLRWLHGRNVKLTHGLAESAAQMESETPAFRNRMKAFIDGLVSHLWLDGGKLVVAHALQGRKGLVQPAVKCRGSEYLRIIYGPEYDAPEHLARQCSRGLGRKRSLAMREFLLGQEAMRRFIAREPLRRVHEAVFAVLALESEPVDPRL